MEKRENEGEAIVGRLTRGMNLVKLMPVVYWMSCLHLLYEYQIYRKIGIFFRVKNYSPRNQLKFKMSRIERDTWLHKNSWNRYILLKWLQWN